MRLTKKEESGKREMQTLSRRLTQQSPFPAKTRTRI